MLSLRRVVVLLVVVLVVVPAGAAQAAPLSPVRSWAQETAGVLSTRTTDRVVQRRIQALRVAVRRSATALLHADGSTRANEVLATEAALRVALAGAAPQLSDRQAYFFFLAYQAQLERLAERGGLSRTATGRPLQGRGLDTLSAEARAKLAVPDKDADGIVDAADKDDNSDGIADARDPSDLGWGIADAYAVRVERRGGYCVPSTNAIPDPRTVAAGAAWRRRATAAGCSAPRLVHADGAIQRLATIARAAKKPKTKAGNLVTLSKVGFKAQSAKLDRKADPTGGTLVLTFTAKKSGSVTLDVLAGSIVVASAKRKIVKGRRALTVVLSNRVTAETPRLRITLKVGKQRGRGTLALTPEPPVPPTPPLPPVDPDPQCSADTDLDTVTDCMERKGFELRTDVPSLPCQGSGIDRICVEVVKRQVFSDPMKANTDDDAVTVNGKSFELTDKQEWASGGVSDPSSKDTDTDGVPDVEEIQRWATLATNPDTDGDGVEYDAGKPIGTRAELYDRAEIDGGIVAGSHLPTSPTESDTDGDGVTDTDEILGGSTNPLLAEVPAYTLSPVANETFLIQIGKSLENSVGLTNSQSAEQAKEQSNTEADSKTTSNTFKIGIEAHADSDGIGGSITSEYEYSSSSTRESSATFSNETRQQSQKASESTLASSADPKGSISIRFRLANSRSDMPVTVRNLGVDATFICQRDVAGATCGASGQRVTLGHMVPKSVANTFTIGPGAFQDILFSDADVSADLLRALAANPSNLSFAASGGDLLASSEGANLLDSLGRSIPQNTGGVEIDDGRGHVRSYSVATSVTRDWGKPSASQAPPTSLADALRYASVDATYHDIPGGGKAIQSLHVGDIDRAHIPAAGRLVKGSWALLANVRHAPADYGHADEIKLVSGDKVILAYVKDEDGDGLTDREEKLLGTSDQNADTDGDGATGSTDACRARKDCLGTAQDDATYPSDYFESNVGWMAGPILRADGTTTPQVTVHSNAALCDGDNDGLLDGPACGGLKVSKERNEQALHTDPADSDTDGDGQNDLEDAAPLAFDEIDLRRKGFSTKKLLSTDATSACNEQCLRLTNRGSTVYSPQFSLCGPSATGIGCASDGGNQATGLYKLSWEVRNLQAPSAVGTFEVLDESAKPTRVVLRASLDGVERGHPMRELFFTTYHAPGAVADRLRVRFTNRAGTEVLLFGVTISEVANQAAFLDQGANANLTALAIPGSMFPVAESAAASAAPAAGDPPAATPPSTAEELSLNPAALPAGTLSDGPEDLSLPYSTGNWRARFGLRMNASSIPSDAVAAIGVGTSPTAQPRSLANLATTDITGPYFGPNGSRVPVVYGIVRAGDIQAAGSRLRADVSMLFEVGGRLPNVTLPVRVTSKMRPTPSSPA